MNYSIDYSIVTPEKQTPEYRRVKTKAYPVSDKFRFPYNKFRQIEKGVEWIEPYDVYKA